MSVEEKHNAARKRIVEAARSIVGERGFSAVGISQILEVASIPKGSFYHYFDSKEAFGEELLRIYMADYLQKMDALFSPDAGNAADQLFAYFRFWQETHVDGKTGDKCLIVKLAAEVSDLSERMRRILDSGTAQAIDRIASTIAKGQQEGSVRRGLEPQVLAGALYQLWLGATLMVKITHRSQPFEKTLRASEQLLIP
ncbi:TetR/AcrR family transcriptional regulator [Acetobacter okinawensis]|uniref:TetR/AcrR family transcriptional regulator n=1 Tax=Acetobacter okinawensis TaxID=1076594 RepID=UPI00209E3455|nr:TetR/AcrR family transcriptional regulator [Acetobacter okinawensis]MCP1212764.1 TetR/AcrR family transcriptional regulator [Acetobacter okinawensis]